MRPFLYNGKIYFCSDWTACEQCLSTLSCATHAHTKNLLDRCAQSIYQRIAQEKLYKICKNGPVLSSSFCTMWAKQQNNQSISPRNNRTPSTFYNAGKYFESDWDNNLITTKPYTLCHGEEPGYEAILKQLYCHRYYWQDCFLPFNLAGVLICREHTDLG